VNPFLQWKERLVSRPDIMGGTMTFPHSRLTVCHVGGMIVHGIDAQKILKDIPTWILQIWILASLCMGYPNNNILLPG
jgi:uncharacterized protein (DUF433 family)